MAENNTFEAIMREISQGLTGNPEDDMKYLQEQGDKYKDHEYGKEILLACGRMMYELIPDDKKAELNKILEKDNKGIDAALEEIRFNIYKKNYDKALKLMESTVEEHEKSKMFMDDAVSEYHCFREPMEEILYTEYTHPEKDVRGATVDYAEMYLLYGSLLVEIQRPEDAEKALEKAMKWNPASTQIAFEHAESLKIQGKIDEFKDATMNAFRYAFRPDELARCYRNLSYYFVEKKEYETAVCCLLFSTQYGKSDMVQSELYYISQMTGKNIDPSEEDLDKCFKEHGIPFGPEIEMLKIAYAYGRHFYEDGNMQAAGYFLDIFTSFINDDEANKMMEDIKAKLEGGD